MNRKKTNDEMTVECFKLFISFTYELHKLQQKNK